MRGTLCAGYSITYSTTDAAPLIIDSPWNTVMIGVGSPHSFIKFTTETGLVLEKTAPSSNASGHDHSGSRMYLSVARAQRIILVGHCFEGRPGERERERYLMAAPVSPVEMITPNVPRMRICTSSARKNTLNGVNYS